MKLLQTGSFPRIVPLSCVVVMMWLWPALTCGTILPDWSYDKLFAKSDLVVIAAAESSSDSAAKFTEANPWKVTFAGVETVLKVQLIIKGKEPEKTVKVHHFRLEGAGGINFFPHLVSFDTKKGKPDYLVFLKRVRNGVYQPVSGQGYAGLSVFECNPVPKRSSISD